MSDEMTARTGDVIEQAARVIGMRLGFERVSAGNISRALADAGLLARPLPTRDEIADELAGWPLGSGYYTTSVLVDEAQAMADAVLALLEGGKR